MFSATTTGPETTSSRADVPSTLRSVGVTSGASVPEELVSGVLDWLAARGYGDVSEVESAKESLLFALPPELRRDLRAAGKA